MSLTSTVPAVVPSLFQSSTFWYWPAVKKRVPATSVKLVKLSLGKPVGFTLIGVVPAAVPSLTHRSGVSGRVRGLEEELAVARGQVRR